MNLLVIGSGGREHAIAWKLAQSPQVNTVFVAPGNGGTVSEAKLKNIALTKIDDLINFAKKNDISFTVVGPEAALAEGIVDRFREHKLKIWGPTKFCTQLESSKAYAKEFMLKYKIPTANYAVFTDEDAAKDYLLSQQFPTVLKADGLAAGKGVLVAENLDEAVSFIQDIFSHNKFGTAGNKVVIEEFLSGTEASFIVMIDGKNITPLASSQDHKRLLNSDKGPNTGGMGAYSPAPIITDVLHQKIIAEVIQPVIAGMHNEEHEYSGFLYAGLMIDNLGNFKTLEFNCRLGDPETQPILMRLKSDFATLIQAGLDGKLDMTNIEWKDEFAVGVVIAAHGYPDSPRLNDNIIGIEQLTQTEKVKVFHAGTKVDNGNLLTSGGRVLCVVATAKELKQAQQYAYQAIEHIKIDGMQYRTDIANKALGT